MADMLEREQLEQMLSDLVEEAVDKDSEVSAAKVNAAVKAIMAYAELRSFLKVGASGITFEDANEAADALTDLCQEFGIRNVVRRRG